ncbi:MAG: hypothetical protein HQL32_10740, partial [Planctomycetes bacterium]|nr:hypothetical protein [Planctomycetota bacterium]
AIDNSEKAEVSKILMTHHDPARTDDQLDDLLKRWQKYKLDNNYKIDVDFAMEGQVYSL